ncbi:hypothetical protein [Flavobacterium sp.]|uniref:hypothetical protein n=1 Tax=Flavobacterium sp. TaxID=239 RepID=UPI00286C347A|nr:hypothetical protein [Flavobacterium sp.]
MSTSELKLDLIQSISTIEDTDLLNDVKKLLSLSSYEKVYVLNQRQQQSVNESIEQYKSGQCISDEDAENEFQKWLIEK